MATLERGVPSKFNVHPGVCAQCERRLKRLDGYRDRCPMCDAVTINAGRARLSIERVFGPTAEIHAPRGPTPRSPRPQPIM